ncbi:hypothetical protein ElyMa_002543700, partial [Elysia marginata]
MDSQDNDAQSQLLVKKKKPHARDSNSNTSDTLLVYNLEYRILHGQEAFVASALMSAAGKPLLSSSFDGFKGVKVKELNSVDELKEETQACGIAPEHLSCRKDARGASPQDEALEAEAISAADISSETEEIGGAEPCLKKKEGTSDQRASIPCRYGTKCYDHASGKCPFFHPKRKTPPCRYGWECRGRAN